MFAAGKREGSTNFVVLVVIIVVFVVVVFEISAGRLSSDQHLLRDDQIVLVELEAQNLQARRALPQFRRLLFGVIVVQQLLVDVHKSSLHVGKLFFQLFLLLVLGDLPEDMMYYST